MRDSFRSNIAMSIYSENSVKIVQHESIAAYSVDENLPRIIYSKR